MQNQELKNGYNMSDELMIKQTYYDLCNASINKDKNKLLSILDDNYILVHMTGLKQSKNEYINAVLTGDLKYYEVKHESVDISIYEDMAIVIGKTKTFASPFGMTKSWWNLKQKLELKKINGKWLIVKSVASTY